jgi:hypothetical protein
MNVNFRIVAHAMALCLLGGGFGLQAVPPKGHHQGSVPGTGAPSVDFVMTFAGAPSTVYLIGNHFGQSPGAIRIFINNRPLSFEAMVLRSEQCIVIPAFPHEAIDNATGGFTLSLGVRGVETRRVLPMGPLEFPGPREVLAVLRDNPKFSPYLERMEQAFGQELAATEGAATSAAAAGRTSQPQSAPAGEDGAPFLYQALSFADTVQTVYLVGGGFQGTPGAVTLRINGVPLAAGAFEVVNDTCLAITSFPFNLIDRTGTYRIEVALHGQPAPGLTCRRPPILRSLAHALESHIGNMDPSRHRARLLQAFQPAAASSSSRLPEHPLLTGPLPVLVTPADPGHLRSSARPATAAAAMAWQGPAGQDVPASAFQPMDLGPMAVRTTLPLAVPPASRQVLAPTALKGQETGGIQPSQAPVLPSLRRFLPTGAAPAHPGGGTNPAQVIPRIPARGDLSRQGSAESGLRQIAAMAPPAVGMLPATVFRTIATLHPAPAGAALDEEDSEDEEGSEDEEASEDELSAQSSSDGEHEADGEDSAPDEGPTGAERKDNTAAAGPSAPAAMGPRPRSDLPRKDRHEYEAQALLKAWFKAHLDHPYPKDAEKRALAIATKMNLSQVSDWFTNTRKRWWWEHPTNPVLNEWRALGRPPAMNKARKPARDRAASGPSAKLVPGKRKPMAPRSSASPIDQPQAFTPHATDVLTRWAVDHLAHPYPSVAQKTDLAVAAQVSFDQVTHWYINYRSRHWKYDLNLPDVQKNPSTSSVYLSKREREALATSAAAAASAPSAQPAPGPSQSQDRERGRASAAASAARGRKRGPGRVAAKAQAAQDDSDPDYDPDEEPPSKRRQR